MLPRRSAIFSVLACIILTVVLCVFWRTWRDNARIALSKVAVSEQILQVRPLVSRQGDAIRFECEHLQYIYSYACIYTYIIYLYDIYIYTCIYVCMYIHILQIFFVVFFRTWMEYVRNTLLKTKVAVSQQTAQNGTHRGLWSVETDM